MYKMIYFLLVPAITLAQEKAPSPESILQKVDDNMIAKTSISESQMVINGKRNSRTITSKGYARGEITAFTEYLSPAREKGTKMLKLEDRLWIYSPSTDRTIQLSGHMLRQSVMGSDMSYEDAMEDRRLNRMYNAKVTGEESINDRKVWVMELNAKVENVTYEKQKMWVDQERFVPLKQEMYAKSGQLLKRVILENVQKIDGHWYPMKMNFKDMLKDGKGTDFIVTSMEFDVEIPEYIFSKASLKQ
ncbi:MAG: outer membrane lipoprotein-sorting protein [Eudoraea sp.]|uniref:outer membrane lipoprotein-sorting protein n=1 Tax=Eudoraea sp. TaxID=1979955 RepID=UPI00326513D1